MTTLREALETRQVSIYFAAILAAAGMALAWPTPGLMALVEPALALMLFATFLQVPLADLGRALLRLRFLCAIATANFVFVPVLVFALAQFAPDDPLLRLGVLLVLLAPCIDYVVTFSHIGRADSRALLASTPVLLLLQMLLLPVYLGLFLGETAAELVRIEPFVDAFVRLILVPLALAGAVQFGAGRVAAVASAKNGLNLMPVPATALVLFLVFASVVSQLGSALGGALRVVPLYVAYAVIAPFIGWTVGRLAGLGAAEARATAFSAATRNSLVILPLGLAVPGDTAPLAAVVVMQTVVELLFSLAYMRLMPRLGRDAAAEAGKRGDAEGCPTA
ncbi:MAG: arsenic resistance protein [Methylobacterium mesophilicum]|nr:arsenic resistance protein [Methylobacterium mesophilicum]